MAFEIALTAMDGLPTKPYRYLSAASGASLSDLLEAMERGGRVAVDVEADSLHHYREKVCLIQITAGGEDFIVDPLSGLEITPLLEALASRPILLHGADYDLRMLKNSFGFTPRGGIFDTMLAAQLLGYEQIGFAALVQRFFGVTLSKRGQKSDWSHRPLSPAQLEYARCDTHFLGPLAPLLETELEKMGRRGWHEETCEAALRAAMAASPPEDPEAWRVKGAGFCSRRELAFLKALWHWREEEARAADRPRFKVIGDAPLLSLAKWGAASQKGDLSKGPRLPRDFRGRRYRSLAEMIRRTRALPEGEWPERPSHKRPRHRAPDCSAAIEKLRGACMRIAHDLKITPSIVAPRASIVAIAQVRPQGIEEAIAVGRLLRWQAELLWPAIERLWQKGKKS